MNLMLLLLSLLLVVTPTHAARNGTACTTCPAGRYQSPTNCKRCLPCPAGRYRRTPGAIALGQCVKCRVDTYAPGHAATRCVPCRAGTFSGRSATRCVVCPPGSGFHGPKCARCNKGFANDGKQRECQFCPSGTEAPETGAKVCTPCRPGMFRDVRNVGFPGAGRCLPCPVASFAKRRGSMQCTRCPLGTSTRISGGATKCTPCPTGTARGRVQATRCTRCVVGTTSIGVRAAACRDGPACPFGTMKASDGSCRACLPGSRLTGTGKCVACPRGHVSRGGTARVCVPCAAGKLPIDSLSMHQGSACICKPGSRALADGTCRKCRAGEYGLHTIGTETSVGSHVRSDDIPFAACHACPGGTVSSREGATSCRTCPDRWMNAGGTARERTACRRCAPGTISPAGDRTYCVTEDDNCRQGYVRFRGGGCVLRFCVRPEVLVWGTCGRCVGHEKVDEENGICAPCGGGGPGRTNPSVHSRTYCTKCGPNSDLYVFPYNYKSCTCYDGFGRAGSGGGGRGECKRCAAGTVSVEERCIGCKEGVAIKERFGRMVCGRCAGESVQAKVEDKTCTACPEGTKRAVDVLGVPMDVCV